MRLLYNTSMIFDGRAFAKEIEAKVAESVAKLPTKPKIVSILVGNEPASVLYTNLKQKAAERVGIGFEVERIDSGFKIEDLRKRIEEIGTREDVAGVMVQMPIPGLSREEQEEIIKLIPLSKDVDGLRWEESGIIPATVRAILSILESIEVDNVWGRKFVVVGTHGSVGKPLLHFLRERGVKEIAEVNSQTEDPGLVIKGGEVVIACVGKAGLVKEIMPGAIAVDVGISRVDGKTVGDMTDSVYNAALVAVPVPGGVGPVTVACLMENTIHEEMYRGSSNL